MSRRRSHVPGRLRRVLELDFCRRVRSSIKAAKANAESYQASLEDVQVIDGRGSARITSSFAIAAAAGGGGAQPHNQRETFISRRCGAMRASARSSTSPAGRAVAAIEASLPPIRAALAERNIAWPFSSARGPGHLELDLSPSPYPPAAKELTLGDPDSLLRPGPTSARGEAPRRGGIGARDRYADLFRASTIERLPRIFRRPRKPVRPIRLAPWR